MISYPIIFFNGYKRDRHLTAITTPFFFKEGKKKTYKQAQCEEKMHLKIPLNKKLKTIKLSLVSPLPVVMNSY